jgi:carotenoid 1,2-hydratase
VASGAYLWWYVDALSDDGRHALTLIAFVGSVFSPYYRRAQVRGVATADDHCALNVVLYTPGRKRWTMTERGARHVSRERHNFRIGPSHLRWTGQALVIDIDERATPLPHRVRGRITVHPQGLSPFVAGLDDRAAHRWGPVAPCARVEVQMADPQLSWSGHGYVDSNEGDEPVDRGFTSWDWQRATLADGSTAVLYDTRQTDGRADRVLAVRFGQDGRADRIDPPPRQALPPSGWRICRQARSDVSSPACRTLEDTPFYARSLVQATVLGQPVAAMHETLDTRRLVSPVVQLMLPFRMPRRA